MIVPLLGAVRFGFCHCETFDKSFQNEVDRRVVDILNIIGVTVSECQLHCFQEWLLYQLEKRKEKLFNACASSKLSLFFLNWMPWYLIDRPALLRRNGRLEGFTI